jgi:hypothetical protein
MTEPIKLPEALRLADDLLVMGIPADVADPAAAELRRLHGEVERLRGEKDAVVAAEREAICQIVRWHCVSDKDARRLIEAIRARGEK